MPVSFCCEEIIRKFQYAHKLSETLHVASILSELAKTLDDGLHHEIAQTTVSFRCRRVHNIDDLVEILTVYIQVLCELIFEVGFQFQGLVFVGDMVQLDEYLR